MSGDLTDAGLVERAVRNAGRTGPPRPRWAAVRDVFAVGSTSARVLCRRYGLNPDGEVAPERPRPALEWRDQRDRGFDLLELAGVVGDFVVGRVSASDDDLTPWDWEFGGLMGTATTRSEAARQVAQRAHAAGFDIDPDEEVSDVG